MGQAALSNEKQSAPFLCLSQSPSPKQPHLPRLLKWLELIPAVLDAVGSSFFPLGKVGMDLRTKAMYG